RSRVSESEGRATRPARAASAQGTEASRRASRAGERLNGTAGRLPDRPSTSGRREVPGDLRDDGAHEPHEVGGDALAGLDDLGVRQRDLRDPGGEVRD